MEYEYIGAMTNPVIKGELRRTHYAVASSALGV